MQVNVAKEVSTLKAMSVGELRVRYAEVFGEPTRTGHKVSEVRSTKPSW